MRSRVARLVSLACTLLVGSTAAAQAGPTEAAPPWPRVGGHWGGAVSILNIDNDGTTVIGRDYIQVGITPGINVQLSRHWSIDFEFIAFSRWDRNLSGDAKSSTRFLVDPGLLYDFGPLTLGLRTAVLIGDPFNFALIAIVVIPFDITEELSWFLELDLPAFVTAKSDRTIGSWGVVLQSGFGF